MTLMKRMASLILVLTLLIPAFAMSVPEASAADYTYDPYKAIAYAEAHWNDGKGLCAEFVWNCVRAGGLNLSTKGLHYSPYVTAGVAEAACNAMGIPFTGVKDLPRLDTMSVFGPSVAMKDEPANEEFGIGDLVFTYCETCGKTPHVQICSGYTDGVGAMSYSHNPARQHSMHLGGATSDHNGHTLSLRYLDLSNVEEKDCECAVLFDVPAGEWYHEYIDEVIRKDLMGGVSDHSFDPEGTMTRAMLVTVLWRYNLEPGEGTNNFSDVKNGQWYTQAIAWAAQNGIVGGVGGGRFDPDGNVTREQLATILYRYTKSVGNEVSPKVDLSGFPDAAKVSGYAREAMSWAVAVGLVTGSKEGSQTYLRPQGSATRAQVGAILVRYIEQYGGIPGSGTCGESLTWNLTAEGTLTISGVGEMTEFSFEKTAPWYGYRKYIEKVVIEEGITSLGDTAFSDCSALEEVSLPNSLTEIGASAFRACVSLKSIDLPEGETDINGGMFADCKSLTELRLPQSLTYVDADAFEGCDSLGRLDIPAGVSNIEFSQYQSGNTAFSCPVYVAEENPWYSSDEQGVLFNKDQTILLRGHTKLSGSYTVPAGTIQIGSYAFKNCELLSAVSVPAGVTQIGSDAFMYCYHLKTVELPESLTELGSGAFRYCYRLRELDIPDGISTLGSETFLLCRQLRKIELPRSLTALRPLIFYGCNSLTELEIPAGVTQIASYALYEADHLQGLYFLGDAPEVEEGSIPKDVVLYYIQGKAGWTSPTWNGYQTATWMP